MVMGGQMGGWQDRQMGGWMDRWVDGRIERWKRDGWMGD